MAALWAGDLDRPGGLLAAAEAARAAPAAPEPARAVDVVLDALAIRSPQVLQNRTFERYLLSVDGRRRADAAA